MKDSPFTPHHLAPPLLRFVGRLRGALVYAGLAAAIGATGLLSGCAALLLGGAVGGALSYTDRRTSGAQVEDKAIELKASNRIAELLGNRAHVNVSSYNRVLLITGEVPTEADSAAIAKAVGTIDNVASIVNEVAAMPLSSVSDRANDTLLTTKVKGAFVDRHNIQSNAFKVVTERGTVYLMGRVTEAEATRAADVARDVSGVMKVVKVFDIITEAELDQMGAKDGAKAPAPDSTTDAPK